MTAQEPWSDKWEKKGRVGGGGQGTTYLVVSKHDGPDGVLKVLREQQDAEARRRMYREVANLKILESVACKTPRILDHNTGEFENADIPLYFVMEYIAGESLAALVQRLKSLTIEQSAQLTFDICKTFVKAIAQSVQHRDLKPENVIIRSLEPPDVVIVDYGLSFNRTADEDVTRATETLDNRFLSLPERRVPGGDRRDPRSDLVGICGILFFCLMGEPPVDLVDAKGLPPHRRPGRAIKEKFRGDLRASQLEAFFDRGFATAIDNRFQSLAELEQRLRDVLAAVGTNHKDDPIEVAKRSGALLFRHDRKTQLAAYRVTAQQVIKEIFAQHNRYANVIAPYSLRQVMVTSGHPPDTETIECTFASLITVEHHKNRMCIVYEVAARGSQCAVFRTMCKATTPQFDNLTPLGGWTTVMWYDPTTVPDITLIKEDFKGCLGEAIKTIQEEILSSQPEARTS